jgi:hypothetical protein
LYRYDVAQLYDLIKPAAAAAGAALLGGGNGGRNGGGGGGGGRGGGVGSIPIRPLLELAGLRTLEAAAKYCLVRVSGEARIRMEGGLRR